MHELSVTQQILRLALQHGEAAGAGRVTGLSLAIGELSTFSAEAVGFCWEFLARGTACEGAELSFRRVPAELTCLDCGAVHLLQGELAPCPACGSARLRVSAGDDLILDSIDVETRADRDGAPPGEKPGRDRTDD